MTKDNHSWQSKLMEYIILQYRGQRADIRGNGRGAYRDNRGQGSRQRYQMMGEQTEISEDRGTDRDIRGWESRQRYHRTGEKTEISEDRGADRDNR